MSFILSYREIEIVKLIVNGMTDKEIGNILNISVNTVKAHKKNLFKKTNSRNIADVTRWFYERDKEILVSIKEARPFPSFPILATIFPQQ